MKVELSPGHLYFSTQQEEDGEELSEVDACTVAQAKAEEKLSIVTKLILINDIPLEIIAKVSDLPMEELEKIKKDAEAMAEQLKGVTLTIATKVSATGTIFGSVTNIQIAEELEKLGHKVDRKIIVVKDTVKEVGSYKAIVKLHKEVSVEIPFEVVAE